MLGAKGAQEDCERGNNKVTLVAETSGVNWSEARRLLDYLMSYRCGQGGPPRNRWGREIHKESLPCIEGERERIISHLFITQILLSAHYLLENTASLPKLCCLPASPRHGALVSQPLPSFQVSARRQLDANGHTATPWSIQCIITKRNFQIERSVFISHCNFVYVYMDTHMYTWMYPWIHIHGYIHGYTCVSTYIQVCTCISTSRFILMYVLCNQEFLGVTYQFRILLFTYLQLRSTEQVSRVREIT